jgi:hypothetical protein
VIVVKVGTAAELVMVVSVVRSEVEPSVPVVVMIVGTVSVEADVEVSIGKVESVDRAVVELVVTGTTLIVTVEVVDGGSLVIGSREMMVVPLVVMVVKESVGVSTGTDVTMVIVVELSGAVMVADIADEDGVSIGGMTVMVVVVLPVVGMLADAEGTVEEVSETGSRELEVVSIGGMIVIVVFPEVGMLADAEGTVEEVSKTGSRELEVVSAGGSVTVTLPEAVGRPDDAGVGMIMTVMVELPEGVGEAETDDSVKTGSTELDVELPVGTGAPEMEDESVIGTTVTVTFPELVGKAVTVRLPEALGDPEIVPMGVTPVEVVVSVVMG